MPPPMSSRELIQVRSFDGEQVSGFLYRPDPARFPGRRPLIVNIHGGPEGQSRPGFLGRNNYLINELGIAIFYPERARLDRLRQALRQPRQRPGTGENSVKDIGAFLDRLQSDPALDPARFAVTGGSYGGYMCYASAIRFGDRLRAANCVVAISNWVTFLENTQSYRRDLRRVEYGDERDPAQRARLMAISPLTHVAELRIPLMVVTGAQRSAGAADRGRADGRAPSAVPAAPPGTCSARTKGTASPRRRIRITNSGWA